MTDKETKIQKQHEIKQDPYRFVNLILFLLVALCNSIPCQAFAGVSPAISQIYDITALQANTNSLFFPIMYVIMILPANYIIDIKGLKIGTLICQMCMCLGLTLRCLINYNFYLFLFGTFICSLGFCFMTSAANRFPNIWFLDKQIFAVKSLVLFVLFASDTVGFFISTAFISKQSTKQNIQDFFIIQSAIMVGFHLLAAIFFQDLPKSPQNYSSEIKQQNYCLNLKKLPLNKNYLKLFCAMTFVFANLSIIFVGVAWLGEAYDFGQKQCGYILLTANVCGLIGCAISSLILKQKYKLKCQMFLILSFFSFGLMWIGFEEGNFVTIYLSAGLVGLSVFPFLTTVIDFSAQTAFPIGQATSGGTLLFGGQTFGFTMIIIFSIFIDDSVTKQKCRITQAILLTFIVIGFVILSITTQNLQRNKYEEKRRQQQTTPLIVQQQY